MRNPCPSSPSGGGGPCPSPLWPWTTAAGVVTAGTASADPLGPSGPAKGAPAAPPATDGDAGCTLSPSLRVASTVTSCIGVGAAALGGARARQTATLTVTVKAGRAEKATAVTVDLPTSLAYADGTAATAAVTGAGKSSRATIATRRPRGRSHAELDPHGEGGRDRRR